MLFGNLDREIFVLALTIKNFIFHPYRGNHSCCRKKVAPIFGVLIDKHFEKIAAIKIFRNFCQKRSILGSLIQVHLRPSRFAKNHLPQEVYARFRRVFYTLHKKPYAKVCPCDRMFRLVRPELFILSFWIRDMCVAQ